MVKIDIKDKDSLSSTSTSSTKKSFNGLKGIWDLCKTHVGKVLGSTGPWLVFALGAFFIPFVSAMLVKQVILLTVLAVIFIGFLLYIIVTKKLIRYKLQLSWVVFGFLMYVAVRFLMSKLSVYSFWDISLFADINPYTFIFAGLALFILVWFVAQFKDGLKNMIVNLPCFVVALDVLGFLASKLPTIFAFPVKLVSTNFYNLTTTYFKTYGMLSFYPDVNFWLAIHLLAIFIIVPFLAKSIFDRKKNHIIGRGAILLFLVWVFMLPVTRITFPLLWGIVLLVSGAVYVMSKKYSFKSSLALGLGVFGLFALVLLVQKFLLHKTLAFGADFWGTASILGSYKIFDQIIKSSNLLPGLYSSNALSVLLSGIGIGALGLIAAPLSLINGFVGFNGALVLLVELGLIGFAFWLFIVYLLAHKLTVKLSLSKQIAVVGFIILLLWQAFSTVSIWTLLLLIMFVYIVDLLTAEKEEVFKLDKSTVYGGNAYKMFALGLIASLLVVPLIAKRAVVVLKSAYGVKLREASAINMEPKEAFTKLQTAYSYAQQGQAYCGDCVYFKILRLEALNTIDEMLVQKKDLVKELKLSNMYLEQLQNSMLVLSYDLAGHVYVPDANVLTAYVFEKLSGRSKGQLLKTLTLAKYEDAISLLPNNYSLLYRYATYLMAQESQKGDDIYNRLQMTLALLSRLVGNNQQATFEVALLQARFYTKYGAYDQALKSYSTLEEWLTKQKFKNEEEKKKWIEAIKALKRQVEELKKKATEEDKPKTSATDESSSNKEATESTQAQGN